MSDVSVNENSENPKKNEVCTLFCFSVIARKKRQSHSSAIASEVQPFHKVKLFLIYFATHHYEQIASISL
ncbi:MAG: hypothetical protein JSV46_07335, partial [Candidatus Aminicenantes bacterium]